MNKSHTAPWDTNLILACRRCQKRLRKTEHPPAFAKLKKWLKSRARREGLKRSPLHLIEIPCQKICPKAGLVLFTQSELATHPATFSIIQTKEQMETLYRQAK